MNTKNLKLGMITATAWRLANKGALEFGGTPKQYFAESLRIAWKESKESFEGKGLQIMRYTKTDGTNSYTIVSKVTEKEGKNGTYYQAIGIKGLRNYKNIVLMELTKDNIIKLEKAGYNISR